jgi:hypothetical protein
VPSQARTASPNTASHDTPAQTPPPATIEKEPLADPTSDSSLGRQSTALGVPPVSQTSALRPVPQSSSHSSSQAVFQQQQHAIQSQELAARFSEPERGGLPDPLMSLTFERVDPATEWLMGLWPLWFSQLCSEATGSTSCDGAEALPALGCLVTAEAPTTLIEGMVDGQPGEIAAYQIHVASFLHSEPASK